MSRAPSCRALVLTVLSIAAAGPARAQQPLPVERPPFTDTLSNNLPLAFGMDVEQTARALGQPLHHVSGGSGNEIYLALRSTGGSGLVEHRHRLFLQFRHGRLAGWKGDWGERWMWQ